MCKERWGERWGDGEVRYENIVKLKNEKLINIKVYKVINNKYLIIFEYKRFFFLKKNLSVLKMILIE